MFDLLKIYPMPGGSILSNLSNPSTTKTKNQSFVPSVNNLDPTTSKTTVGFNSNIKAAADKDSLIGKNSKSTTPPFLLTHNTRSKGHVDLQPSLAPKNILQPSNQQPDT